jgi:hypothetical protein
MWSLLVISLGWAQDGDTEAEDASPWNNKFSMGIPRLSSGSTAIALDTAASYQKRRLGFGAHFATDTRSTGDLSAISSTQTNLFDMQLRYTPERPADQWALEGRMELAYEYFSTAYISSASAESEASAVSSFNFIAGGRAPLGGDWDASAWGRLIFQSETYVQIGNSVSFNAESSTGWAAFGIAKRAVGPVEISSATEARSFRIRRLDLFTGGSGGLSDVQLLEVEEQVGVWFSKKILGLQPGIYAGLEVTRASGNQTVTSFTPSIGATLVGDVVDAPSF